MNDFKQHTLASQEKTLNDFFSIRGGVLNLIGTLQTANFVADKQGVQIKGEGLNAGSATIAGATADPTVTTIPGSLKHTGSTAGFYNTTPISKSTVTLGNTNGAIGGLSIGAGYTQAEIVALRDATETLADDVRAIKTALVNLGLIA